MKKTFEYLPNLQHNFNQTLTYYHNNAQANGDLNILTCGHEKCDRDKKAEGPAAVAYYILHYVVSGEGQFVYQNKTHSLKVGDIFLVHPNTVFTYYPKKDNPWEYIWVTFLGFNSNEYIKRCMFSYENPVYHTETESIIKAFQALKDINKYQKSRDIKTLSLLTEIFSLLIEERSEVNESKLTTQQRYIANALSFINKNYYNPDLSLEDIAIHLNLNKNYVSKLFIDVLNVSFSKYLIILRIQKACNLLQETSFSISNIATQVGYIDSLYFSRIFKQYVGYCPSNYKKYNSVNKTGN